VVVAQERTPVQPLLGPAAATEDQLLELGSRAVEAHYLPELWGLLQVLGVRRRGVHTPFRNLIFAADGLARSPDVGRPASAEPGPERQTFLAYTELLKQHDFRAADPDPAWEHQNMPLITPMAPFSLR
jgi:hypothetical protein